MEESCAGIFDLIPMEVLAMVLELSGALPCRLMLISHTNRALRHASLKALGQLKCCELHPSECLGARKKPELMSSSSWLPLRCQAFAEVRGQVHKLNLKPFLALTVFTPAFTPCDSPPLTASFAVLSVQACQIKPRGVPSQSLFGACTSATVLRFCHFSNCDVTELLSTAVACCRSVEEVYLDSSCVTEAGVLHLAKLPRLRVLPQEVPSPRP